jgi:hypothetical protein
MIDAEYSFVDGMIVYPDGVSYNLAEALILCRDRLDEHDRQAIHLVKKLFDGQIEERADADGLVERLHVTDLTVALPYPFSESVSVEDSSDMGQSLDDLAAMFDPFKE